MSQFILAELNNSKRGLTMLTLLDQTDRLPVTMAAEKGMFQTSTHLKCGEDLKPKEHLHHLFEESCDLFHDRPAIICNNRTITYIELDRQANRLARYLISCGIKPADRVGILLKRSINTYVALLAALKAGAVFVPMDTGFPEDRIKYIADDAELTALLTVSETACKYLDIPCQLILLDMIIEAMEKLPASRITETELQAQSPDNLCYIIYTSGSTGTPKGVAIEHPSICNFVRIAASVYGIGRRDRIYQGMTIAFDFSIEEIWPGLISGAAIIAGPDDTRCLGNELADFLIRHKVTVLCCVPTLLATIDRDLPTLRTLIVGGEACPHKLVHRWSKTGRRMLNTYGPTEATVTATWGELHPDKPVTIGRAMPTYTIYLLDEMANPVPDGEIGEICICGVGLARGYINREEQTRKAFIPDTFNTPANPSGKIYRTGDLGREKPDGEIEYLGRIDTQVKIRGYRIELSGIESLLLESPKIRKVVVAPCSFADENQELVAYCELKKGSLELDQEKLYQLLSSQLPLYMVPAFLEILEKIPLLPNGKVDRKQLPLPTVHRFGSSRTEFVAPENRIEQDIAAELALLLNLEQVSVTDDFFHDLGAHSLIVARLVSSLRNDTAMACLGLSDCYRYPTVRKLAAYIETQEREETSTEETQEQVPQADNKKVWMCGVVQLLSISLVTALYALPGLLVFKWLIANAAGNPMGLYMIFSSSCYAVLLSISLAFIFPILLKWLILGRVQPGSYPLWGRYFFRLWLVNKVIAMAPLALLNGTPLLSFYFQLLGAKIAQNVVLASPLLQVPDLITIGEGSSINTDTRLFASKVECGMIHLAPVTIGNNCCVGSNSVIMPGACMEDGAELGDQSLLNGSIPAGESWNGSPARPDTKKRAPISPATTFYRGLKNPVLLVLFLIAALGIVLVPLLAVVPAIICSLWGCLHFGRLWLFVAAPFAGISFVIALNGLIVILKKLVLPNISPGHYSIYSLLYVRKWFVDRLMELSLGLTNSLYSTLYLAPFLRLLGAKIGKMAEVSTISHITPDLLHIDDESFVADIAHVGPLRIEGNSFSVHKVQIGKRSFIGNAAFVPAKTRIGSNSLIGVLSQPPAKDVAPGTTWLGSPPINLPEREQSQDFPEHLTFSPTRGLFMQRLGYEFFRVTLPVSISFLASFAIIAFVLEMMPLFSVVSIALLLGPVILGIGLLLTCVTAGLKKILIGTYQPKVRPMWSSFVWRTELITALYENIVVPWLLSKLTGTPFMAPVLRLLGVKIGRRCFLDTTYMTEFDLVEIGDDCCIGPACSLQTHLFEDRVMKMSRLSIGNRCSIGPRSVILYDAVLEDGAVLDGLTLIMKGETVSASSRWHGVPAIKQ